MCCSLGWDAGIYCIYRSMTSMEWRMFNMRDGDIKMPRDVSRLFKLCKYFVPDSSEFSAWARQKSVINLTGFQSRSMRLLLAIIYDNTYLTLQDSDIDYIDFISLCNFLLLEESFLLARLFPSPRFFDHMIRALTFIYSSKFMGYSVMAHSLLHCMRLSSSSLDNADTCEEFIRSVNPGHVHCIKRAQPLCHCHDCREWYCRQMDQLFLGIYQCTV